jgi:hypothetical protein
MPPNCRFRQRPIASIDCFPSQRSQIWQSIEDRSDIRIRITAWPCPSCMAMSVLHGHVRATWPCCPCCMAMSVLHGHVHAAWPCLCCMAMSILPVYVDAACLCQFCMSMFMLHVYVSILHIHATSGRRCTSGFSKENCSSETYLADCPGQYPKSHAATPRHLLVF